MNSITKKFTGFNFSIFSYSNARVSKQLRATFEISKFWCIQEFNISLINPTTISFL